VLLLRQRARVTALVLGGLVQLGLQELGAQALDLLLDRGLMGEGCINIRQIRGWVEEAGFDGYNEVEIFSNRYWAMDQEQFLERVVEAYTNHA